MPSNGVDVGVEAFYRGKSVFITGGTGFIGKVLVEKLLYSCPGIDTLFLMMRTKRNKPVETRLEEMFKLPMFNRIRDSDPSAFKKVVVVPGDVSLEDLGMTDKDRTRVLQEVSVVFHCAAMLKMEASLGEAVNMNTGGTWRMIQLCRDMPKLEAFVHLSTTYCHMEHEVLEERVYPFRDDAHEIMRRMLTLNEDQLKQLTPSLIAPHPNSYTYTKRLSEQLIVNEHPNMPVAIARPSIVTPAQQEPLPGWVDSLNGPMGLLAGSGKGVLRSMHCESDVHADIIPVDVLSNGLVAIAWKIGTAEKRPESVPVFNLTMKAMTWGRLVEIGRPLIFQFPFEKTVWYPDGKLRTSKWMHNLCVIFCHFLPAYFVDFLMLIFRQERFMVRLQWRIQGGLKVLQYFATRKWNFKSDNFTGLRKVMSERDNNDFSMSLEEFEDRDYMTKSLLGLRQYCLKEDLSSLPSCRRKLKILWVIDKLWTLFFYYMIFSLFYSNSESVRYVYDLASDRVRQTPVLRDLLGTDNATNSGH